MTTHPIEVKSRLTPEEFLALEALRSADGLSQSSYIRMLINRAAREHAMAIHKAGMERE